MTPETDGTQPAADLWMRGRRVLVLEDEYFIADEISRFLVDAGAQVVGPVPNMEKALALLDDGAIDCAVLDINLHGEAVFPVARMLRERNLPWIYVTGYDSPTIPPDLKGIAFIAKPINKVAFRDAMKGLV